MMPDFCTDCAQGEFVNGLLHGKGMTFFADGSTFEGSYVQGAPHGHGTYTTATR